MKKLLILFPLLIALAACGKRGPLVPPESLVPAPIKDLQVEQKGDRFLVCWSPPGRQESGGALSGLAGFRVFRREVLPPNEDCEECPTAYRPVKTVDPEYLQDVRRVGPRYCFHDDDLMVGKTYQYKAVSIDKDGAASRDSNRARAKKTTPPLPPELSAVPAPNGVALQLRPATTAEGVTVTGFSVYRRQQGEIMPLLPIARLTPENLRYEDPHMEHGVTYFYGVRTIAKVQGQLVESDLSPEVEGKFSLSE